MMIQPPAPSIVMGIDGSQAAVNAAKWAVPEAVSRDIPLCLVHVAPVSEAAPAAWPEDFGLEVEYAETALRKADAAVADLGATVKVDTAVLHGRPDRVLVEQSSAPTATSRPPAGSRSPSTIPPALTDDVIRHGFEEAALRQAPLLALADGRWRLGNVPGDQLNRQLERWMPRSPDVQVRRVVPGRSVAHYLATIEEPVQLVVVVGGAADTDQVTQLVGPHSHPLLPHPNCSVLMIPQEAR